MSSPKLVANQDYLLVEIRYGNEGDSWEQMTQIEHPGPCVSSQEWIGEEGQKLCARFTSYPGQQPPAVSYCATGFAGIREGEFEVNDF